MSHDESLERSHSDLAPRLALGSFQRELATLKWPASLTPRCLAVTQRTASWVSASSRSSAAFVALWALGALYLTATYGVLAIWCVLAYAVAFIRIGFRVQHDRVASQHGGPHHWRDPKHGRWQDALQDLGRTDVDETRGPSMAIPS
jgi:hypothetical protein